MKRLVAVAGLALLCSSAQGVEIRADSFFVSPLLAPFVSGTVARCNEDLEKIHPPLKGALQEIIFTTFRQRLTPFAFVSPQHPSTIVFHVSGYSLCALAHEVAHTYEQTISESNLFSWTRLVDTSVSYWGESRWERPQKGFLEEYGAKRCTSDLCSSSFHYHEDIATFVEDIYSGYQRIALADPSDPRYSGKLRLLRAWDFISENQYDSAMTLLGSKREN